MEVKKINNQYKLYEDYPFLAVWEKYFNGYKSSNILFMHLKYLAVFILLEIKEKEKNTYTLEVLSDKNFICKILKLNRTTLYYIKFNRMCYDEERLSEARENFNKIEQGLYPVPSVLKYVFDKYYKQSKIQYQWKKKEDIAHTRKVAWVRDVTVNPSTKSL